jgi:soluble lytic murein transglycosylase-like protein
VRHAYAALVLSLLCGAAHAEDCFNQAAAYQGVNPSVLRAVAWFESKGDASAINRNANGSIDVGQLQINSIHFGDLAREGVPHRALTDPCVNVYVAAWLLKQKMVKYGNTWRAIGAYHSESPRLRDAYARSIQKILVRGVSCRSRRSRIRLGSIRCPAGSEWTARAGSAT